jgi:hypothetical protein
MPNARSKSRSTTKPTRQARLPKKSDLVVAIDFGTTYTGVAFAYDLPHAPHLERHLTPEQLRDKVTALKSWPGVAGSYSDKVPSILAYDSNGQVTAWGGNVNSSHLTSVAHFKLGLEKGVRGYYSINTDPTLKAPSKRSWQTRVGNTPISLIKMRFITPRTSSERFTNTSSPKHSPKISDKLSSRTFQFDMFLPSLLSGLIWPKI